LQCRQSGVHERTFQYKILGNHPSFLNFVYRYLYQHLSERLHIDEAIIDYNLTRLDEAMLTIAMNNDQQYCIDNDQHRMEERDITFDVSQMAIALEIFLQTDGNSIYMNKFFVLFTFDFSRYVIYENMFLSWCTTSFRRRSFLCESS
jgi:hypothetical protein